MAELDVPAQDELPACRARSERFYFVLARAGVSLPRRTGARPSSSEKVGDCYPPSATPALLPQVCRKARYHLFFIVRPCPGRPNPKQETKMRDFAGISAPVGADACDGRYWARTSDLRLVEAALSQLS